MKTIPTKTYFLQMLARPQENKIETSETALVLQAHKPTLSFYKYLYVTVGRDWLWINRLLKTDEELHQLITSKDTEIHVLYVGGVPAGFAELDRSIIGEVELVYFGLIKEFIGKGLGKYFLNFIVDKVWSYSPDRFWLHTCQNDHNAALAVYQKAGFEIHDEKIIDEVIPTKEEVNRLYFDK